MTRFSLDANVLVYAADGRAGHRHVRALHILVSAARRDCVLTLQALGEFFHAATRKRIVPRHDAAEQLKDLLATYAPLRPTSKHSGQRWKGPSVARAASGTMS